MKNKEELITVIVPVYNVEKYLDCCVKSIVNQTYHNLEIILVDDGSTDCSGTKCEEWTQRDERITVIHQNNSGLSAARNVGIENAQGQYIAFIDSDDFIHRNFVKTMYDACIEYNVPLCVCGILETLDETVNNSCVDIQIELVKQQQLYEQLYSVRNVETVSAANKLYAIELFDEIRYPVGRRNEDEATIHFIIEKTDCAAWISKPLYFYRQTPNSITRQPYNLKMLDELWSKEVRLEFFKSREMNDLYQKALYVYCSRIIYHTQQLIMHSDAEYQEAAKVYRNKYLVAYKKLLKKDLALKQRIRLCLYYFKYIHSSRFF